MAFAAKDGSQHTNMDTMKRSDASFASKQPAAAPGAAPDQGGGDILQSPEIQQLFQLLAQAGVSPEELSQAYAQVSGDGGGGDPNSGAPAPAAGGGM